MTVVRTLLAVVLAAVLLGVTLPIAEPVERDRDEAVAAASLDRLATAAERLAATNDPVADGTDATAWVTLHVPAAAVADGGHVLIDDGTLAWRPTDGAVHTVEASVPIRTVDPIVLAAGRHRLRLRLRPSESSTAPAVEIDTPGRSTPER